MHNNNTRKQNQLIQTRKNTVVYTNGVNCNSISNFNKLPGNIKKLNDIQIKKLTTQFFLATHLFDK